MALLRVNLRRSGAVFLLPNAAFSVSIAKSMRRHSSKPPHARRDDDRGEREYAPKTSWNKVAKWYGSHLHEKETFQETLVFPGALALLNVKKGGTYLDVACGEGSFARLVAKAGADVVGVDAAPALIRAAQKKQIRGATFMPADAARLTQKVRGPFDGATCILALQNMRDMGAVLREVASVLKRGSPLVLVLNHPVLRIPRQSSWEWDPTKKMQFRRLDMYMSETEIPIQMRPGEDPHLKTFSYHRPLSAYIAALAKAGFAVDVMDEWISARESDSGPRAKAENRARNEFPLFMAIRAVKQ